VCDSVAHSATLRDSDRVWVGSEFRFGLTVGLGDGVRGVRGVRSVRGVRGVRATPCMSLSINHYLSWGLRQSSAGGDKNRGHGDCRGCGRMWSV